RDAARQNPAPPAAQAPAAPSPGLVRLDESAEVWVDRQKHQVVVGGAVVFREGPLEMFACPKNTKEHESVVVVNAKAYLVHAALLAVGAKPGSPVSFQPKYKAAMGPIVKIEAMWKDKDGKEKRVNAQEWVRDVATKKAMKHDWVFAGSGFWKDPETGKSYYHAESGELICVSNFSTATLDLTVNSSQANSDLLFEAFTENIPELGTPVKLVLTPELEEKEK
ncbi:MAG: hypothetical protein KDA99_24860, partial [Planctomycetales bacterium]|nr:hypothetical protein [Planctomycetales bacterium]